MSYPLGPSPGGASSSELPSAPLDVAIVGAGRVGCSIGRALLARGHRVVAVSVANQDSARRVLDVLGHVAIVEPQDAPLEATVVVIAVPDDALAGTAADVASGLREGAVVVHTSGIHGTDVLAPCGENVAAIHPAQTIPEPTTELEGVYFGVTAPEQLKEWAAWFVGELGGIPVEVPEEQRVLYHAALSMASNFTVALAADAADLLQNRAALEPLLRQTIENVIRLGGDAGTVRAHIAALSADAPHLLESYVGNARRALDRAVKAGRLEPSRARVVEDALAEALVR